MYNLDTSKLYENAPYIAAGVVGVASAAYLLNKIINRPPVYNDPPDTVILCSALRGPAAPNYSMFPLKLETYLRLAKIPHKVVDDRGMSPKNKTPYIMLNGETISDSQLCIEFLNKKFNIDLDKSLSAEERGISRAFRKMMEEGFYWNYVLERWIYDKGDFVKTMMKNYLPVPILSTILLSQFRKTMKNYSYCQGMGRHSKEEVRKIGYGDLKALSDFLGKKPYCMGDQITEIDCSIFGFLCQCKFHAPGTIYEQAVTKDFPNLDAYIERVKKLCWEDWDDCITHNGTKKALK